LSFRRLTRAFPGESGKRPLKLQLRLRLRLRLQLELRLEEREGESEETRRRLERRTRKSCVPWSALLCFEARDWKGGSFLFFNVPTVLSSLYYHVSTNVFNSAMRRRRRSSMVKNA